MTSKQRNIKLKHYITCLKCECSGKCCEPDCDIQFKAGNFGEIIENLEAISEIIEQEPCEDCISRQAVNDGFKKYDSGSFAYGCVWDYINKLPSVTPKEKTGWWISFGIQGEIDGQIVRAFTCSRCGAISIFRVSNGNIVNGDLCPNCGAKMIEPQESENKEDRE